MTKTLTINAYENSLLLLAIVQSPLEGLRIADLPRVEAAKGLFRRERFDGEIAVEVPSDLVPLLRHAWDNLPVGKIPRFDDLPAAVERVTKQLKE